MNKFLNLPNLPESDLEDNYETINLKKEDVSQEDTFEISYLGTLISNINPKINFI